MKVAQYEVLGNDARRHVRPARDDRNVACGFTSVSYRRSSLRDAPLFLNSNPALSSGLSLGPFLLRPAVASLWRGLLFAGAP
jgi:hypothetical protein